MSRRLHPRACRDAIRIMTDVVPSDASYDESGAPIDNFPTDSADSELGPEIPCRVERVGSGQIATMVPGDLEYGKQYALVTFRDFPGPIESGRIMVWTRSGSKATFRAVQLTAVGNLRDGTANNGTLKLAVTVNDHLDEDELS